jgi:threonine dehydrogenase-like Zn-dependent dehydrogenase
MKANCWMGKKDVRVQNVPDPQIMNQQDAIVRITSSAICGSDLHLYNGFIPTMESGDILGHEFMGEVIEVGRGVNKLKKGDRVVVPFPISCGACLSCAEGLFSCCENSNPNASIAEKLWGHSIAGVFGYSHMMGGFAGGQAQYARVLMPMWVLSRCRTNCRMKRCCSFPIFSRPDIWEPKCATSNQGTLSRSGGADR